MLKKVFGLFRKREKIAGPTPGAIPATSVSNDTPIDNPALDLYEFDAFAKVIADSIREIKAPRGTVLALNGAWGAGKSSTVNLIRGHLTDLTEGESLRIIPFASWWFRGEEALALAFFRELYAGLSTVQTKRLAKKLASRVLSITSALGAAADTLGAGGMGVATGTVLGRIGEYIQADEGVEKVHKDLSDALSKEDNKFLVIIDDIDRLSPDEALLIFRIVKSAGQLPNVMYLLVFDRLLAEKIVSDRFPSEGPRYLDKIIQFSFELPLPDPEILWQKVLKDLDFVVGELSRERQLDFMNVFYDVVRPEVKLPRDAARLISTISNVWPHVSSEVEFSDFVAIEALRLFQPALYHVIRSNGDELTGEHPDRLAAGNRLERIFLDRFEDVAERKRFQIALMRLFPVLEGLWESVWRIGGEADPGRRIYTKKHFETYFRYAVGTDTLKARDIVDLLENAGDAQYVERVFLDAIQVRRTSGATKASLLLEELATKSREVDRDKVSPLLTTLFKVADDIDVEEDEGGGFGITNNHHRLRFLTHRLVLPIADIQERSDVIFQASLSAALAWLGSFAQHVYLQHHPKEGSEAVPEQKILTTGVHAEALRFLAREKVESAAANGQLLNNRRLSTVLYLWAEFCEDGGEQVRQWSQTAIASNEGLLQFVRSLTSYSWSFGMGTKSIGDRVSVRNKHFHVESIATIVDEALFRRRIDEVLSIASLGEVGELRAFTGAWDRHRRGDSLG